MNVITKSLKYLSYINFIIIFIYFFLIKKKLLILIHIIYYIFNLKNITVTFELLKSLN